MLIQLIYKLINEFFLVQIFIARKNLNEIELTTLLQGGFERITLQLGKIEI